MKGSDFIRKKLLWVYSLVFTVNMLLFLTKLYIGLSSNSISIYSDGVNNLFDILTGIVSFGLLVGIPKNEGIFTSFKFRKIEQLLTLGISLIISFTALYFAYNSIERLTYPTPVAYYTKYLYIIIFTAVIKLMLFLVLKSFSKKLNSDVVGLIAVDSLLDFFVTGVTVLTLISSKYGKYSIDALCGIAISIVILAVAIKTLSDSVKKLAGLVDKKTQKIIESILKDVNSRDISFIYTADESEAYIKISENEGADTTALSQKIKDTIGINAYFITEKERDK